ncbi:hypothetical protein [Segatella copri]|uniref:hypothetical protein n=1 Tax=Segatella copri TaxID=165179 RepID=UPI003F8B64B6
MKNTSAAIFIHQNTPFVLTHSLRSSWQITIASSPLSIRMPSSNTSASHSIAMPISSRI